MNAGRQIQPQSRASSLHSEGRTDREGPLRTYIPQLRCIARMLTDMT
eukprot:COSAG06_NODE_512_length_14867_cov_28.794962_5_plen_47_part_00